MDYESERVDVVSQLRLLIQRRKWIGLVLFLICAGSAIAVVVAVPDVFESKATVIIERQQIPTELVRSTVTSALETRLQTITQEVLSRDRLAGLVEQFDLYPNTRITESMETVVARMRRDITVDFTSSNRGYQNTTVAFTVRYRGRATQVVAGVTNALASFYVEQNVRVREQQASGTSAFLKAQLDDMKGDLEAMEKRVSDFKTAYTGELPHQQEANLSALEQAGIRLRINSDNRIRASQRLTELERRLAATVAQDSEVQDPAVELEELRAQLRHLRKQYSDKYPDVVRLKTEIAALEETQRVPSTLQSADPREIESIRADIASTNVELKSLQAEGARLDQLIAEYQGRVRTAPLREQQYQVLMRDYETTSELYRSLLLRHKEAELAESMERRQRGEQFRIIEPAIASAVPAAPNRIRLTCAGLMFALLLSAGAMLVAEQLDKSVHNVQELRELTSIPILPSIPTITTEADLLRQRRRAILFMTLTAAGLVVVVAATYVIADGNEQLAAMLMK